MKKIAHLDEIINSSFGMWISSLFGAISGWNPGIAFAEQKEIFFFLLEYMLKNGRIKFIAPGADCYVSSTNPNPRLTIYDIDAQWNAPAGEIVNYFRERWPKDAKNEDDPNLTIYFYEMPGVIWVNDSGELVAP